MGSPRNVSLGSRRIGYSRSMVEKKGSPMYDPKLDRLSKSEKVTMDITTIFSLQFLVFCSFLSLNFKLHNCYFKDIVYFFHNVKRPSKHLPK